MADNELEIPDDEPKKVESTTTEPTAEETIADLKRRLEASDAARAADQQRIREMSARAAQADTEVQDSQLALVTNALETIKQSAEILKQNLAAAYSAGDFMGAAEIQEQIADNSAKKLQLEQGKQQLEIAAKQPKRPQQQASSDPVEAMASTLTPRSADWVRRHPEYARNPRLTQKMLAAHNLAVTDDIQPDTDAYFERVESVLGLKRAAPDRRDDDDATADAAKPMQARSQPAAAPTANAGSLNGSRNSVRLSADEAEIAELNGMTHQEYAAMKAKIKRETRN